MPVGGELVVLGAAWVVGGALVIVAVFWPRIRARLPGSVRTGESSTGSRRSRRVQPPTPTEVPAPFSGKAYVIDGDTIEVNRVRIRLFGMDAPELSQTGGYKARSHMIRLAGGREVEVLPCAIDCYGRTVARVMLGQIDVSERMVLDGFAVAMRRWHQDYVEAEEMSRDNRQGLWRRDPVNGIGDPAVHRRVEKATAGGAAARIVPEGDRQPDRGPGRGTILAFRGAARRR